MPRRRAKPRTLYVKERGQYREVALLGLKEIADLADVSKQAVMKWETRADHPFPDPVARLAGGRVWASDDVEEYLERRLKSENVQRAIRQRNRQRIAELGSAAPLADADEDWRAELERLANS